MCISETLGDVAVTYELPTSEDNETADRSELRVYTINAKAVGSISSKRRVTALCYSGAPEGVSVNVIATGLDNGIIRYAYIDCISLNLQQTIMNYKTKVFLNADYGAVGICS